MNTKLENLKQRVQRYKSHAKGKWREHPFPSDLKQEIIANFTKHSIKELSGALHMPYSTLYGWKRRLEKKQKKKITQPKSQHVDFVQIESIESPPLALSQTVEINLSNPSGTNLSIQLPSDCAKELSCVVESFLKGGKPS